MRAIAIVLLLALSIGCANVKGSNVRASGDSVATVRTCEMLTVYPDGRQECRGAVERAAKGGTGSERLYEALATIAGLVLSGVGVAIAALR